MKALVALVLALAACNKPAEVKPSASGRVEIAVTSSGFEPANVDVPAGKPVTLVFNRKTDKTCAKEIVIPMPDGSKLTKKLPLDTPVEVATTFSKSGKLTYACDMGMVKGTINVN
jgi:plastocyanin domain-containing protein